MYIVAIAWLYVLLLVSIMQPTIFRGIVTFIGAGLLPLALLLYLMGTPHRRRNRERAALEATAAESPESVPDTSHLGDASLPTQSAAMEATQSHDHPPATDTINRTGRSR